MIIQRDLEIECLKDVKGWPESRYFFDMGICRVANGWAQIDTYQDAAYFGTWTNPTTFEFFTYAEGDVIYKKCESKEEYIKEVREHVGFFTDGGEERCLIDPGCGKILNPDKEEGEEYIFEKTGSQLRFIELGLQDLLH